MFRIQNPSQNDQHKRASPSQNDQHKRAPPDPAECEFGPVEFHAQGDEYNPAHKRPRARSMSEDHARS
jgi:hypothetical protein